jgi:hypothetical protein
MISLLRPVPSTACRNSTSSRELIWVRSISTESDMTSLSSEMVGGCPLASTFTVDSTMGTPSVYARRATDRILRVSRTWSIDDTT